MKTDGGGIYMYLHLDVIMSRDDGQLFVERERDGRLDDIPIHPFIHPFILLSPTIHHLTGRKP